ncbi:MAG: heparinase II/III family protein [Hyphomicrobiaceae bacterium]
MTKIALSERMRIAVVRAQGLKRQAAANLAQSRFVRWRHGRGTLGQLVIVPQSLRTCDPSFWAEIESGSFGLSGKTARLNGRSPFQLSSHGAAWQANLHGFSWVRHLEAANDPAAQQAARKYVLDWHAHSRDHQGIVGDPGVRARRILSWITHAPFLLEGATAAEFDAFGRGLSREVMILQATWRNAGEGYARLLALTALVVAHLAVNNRQRQLESTLRLFVAEIERQIHSDGGHVSRSPATLVELLLDWLPLRSCFDTRNLPAPDAFAIAVARMLVMLRYLKLGDSTVARFNGTGMGDPAALATLAAYDDRPLPAWGVAPQSKYARMDCGEAALIVDAGSPPPLAVSGHAHAGCLSFEMSVGHALLFVNAGAPGAVDSDWRAVSRATASHSTVCLGETSSSRLVRNAALEAMLGAVPMQLPANVTNHMEFSDAEHVFQGSHDGYLQRLGLIHERELRLATNGKALHGTDRLKTKAHDRLRRDIPFAVHFHLHPDTACEPWQGTAGSDDRGVVIRLRNGQRWLFRATGAPATIEESIFFTGSSGPRPSWQIVLRGACGGTASISWQVSLDETKPAHSAG